MKSDMYPVCACVKLTVCVTNFDHHFFIPDLLSEEGSYFTDGKFSCHISFFVYTFCRLFDFSQKSNMTLQDFAYTHHSVTQELFLCGLFWKLGKIFGFHRNQCKKEVIYGNAAPG